MKNCCYKILGNESGFVMVVALMIMMVLLVLGLASTTTTTLELDIAQNDKESKQNFFITEGAGIEVSSDVSVAGPTSIAACAGSNRASCLNAYSITDVYTQSFLTTTSDGNSVVTTAKVNDIDDNTWPVNYTSLNYADGQSREYAYRVYYWGMGPSPKGYGADFASYVYDITTRKQHTTAGVAGTVRNVLDQGFIRIGPKAL